jgi:hypothetical protein
MARTIRFNFSLSDRSPRVARYLAPAWWYGACEEFQPAPLLPVSNQYDEHIGSALTWVGEHMVHGGFEDGSVARHAGKDLPRHEPGWEGEMPYSQFLGAWRSGDAEDYSRALRSAYYFADVAVDHAAKSVRMHGYGGDAFSVPMNRLQGCIAGYLETGDPYLLDTARSVTETSYWTNKNSWPRLAVGRDACFIRSAVLLYRYFAEEHFRRMAHECSLMVAHSQRPDGSFGDQAGGTGIHAWGAYVTKPWMGLLALGGVIDYLELFPDEPKLAASVKRFADWLMAERWEHGGGMGWSYQHAYDGGRKYLHHPLGKFWELPTPNLWHHESLGRLLLFCAERFDEPAYFQAWTESHAVAKVEGGDHAVNARLQFLPWVQARLWNAILTPEGVQIDPRHWGPGTPERGEVLTPHGRLRVWWNADGNACRAVSTERPMPAAVLAASGT